jgi:hypothetical protein
MIGVVSESALAEWRCVGTSWTIPYFEPLQHTLYSGCFSRAEQTERRQGSKSSTTRIRVEDVANEDSLCSG